MNIHQEHLLNLLKEIDAFCKEHSITYYCAGGTVIGAARHRGFIPWDDDIDIYMTRENFFAFDEALKKFGPKDRKLEYYEGNHERQAAVARYHKEDDTMFCHFNMLGHSSAGTSIDVFILDPLPDDFEERIDYRAKLYAYSDLISPCHVYSHRLPTSKYDIYDKYKKIADEQGRPKAVEMVSEEIFNYDASKCKDYTLRWGSITLIYPIEVIGEPSYLPFEDMMIPVPQDWYKYLAIHYGMDWYNLPYEETQGEHLNIVRYDMGYDYFYKCRDELYTQDYLLDLHFKWKDAEREFFRVGEPMKNFAMQTQNCICRANIEKNLKRLGVKSAKELYDREDYRSIIEAYEPYISMQTSHAYMGRLSRHGLQFPWNFPYIMPLSDDEITCLLGSLMRNGGQRTAEKLVGIYRRANLQSSAVDEIEKIIEVVNESGKLYYSEEYESCMKKILGYADWEQIPMLRDLLWLAKVQLNPESIVSDLGNEATSDNASEASRKAWGDLLWNTGKQKEAEEVYRNLMKTCRNGLFWLDIESKIPDIEPIPTKRLTPFTETAVTIKQKELLEEIADICSNNGIKYVLGTDLARRIYLTGNIGYDNKNREIFMDAANAAKFMKAFGEVGRSDRKLLSWITDDKVRDFALVYSDESNVYCDFRRLEQWRDMGLFITIRILRDSGATKSHKRKALLEEFCVNLSDMEIIDKNNLQSGSKKLVYRALHILPKSYRKTAKRKTFERNLAAEQQVIRGNYYYYTNERGMKPIRHLFERSLWSDTTEVEMSGVKYIVPTATTARYVAHETDLANVPPIESIFIYRSSDMSWNEITPLIDDDAYTSLDWFAYAKTGRKFRKIGNEVWHSWWMILKLGEELDCNEAAEETVSEYRKASEADDEGAMGDAMKEVDATVKKYAAIDIPINLESSLNECYHDYLRRTGQGDFIKKMAELSQAQ